MLRAAGRGAVLLETVERWPEHERCTTHYVSSLQPRLRLSRGQLPVAAQAPRRDSEPSVTRASQPAGSQETSLSRLPSKRRRTQRLAISLPTSRTARKSSVIRDFPSSSRSRASPSSSASTRLWALGRASELLAPPTMAPFATPTFPFRDVNLRVTNDAYTFTSPSYPDAPALVIDRPTGDIRLGDANPHAAKRATRVSSIAGILGVIQLRLGTF